MTLVVILTVRADAVPAFREYERAAAAIMTKHGGAIERVVEVPPAAAGAPLIEIHVVTFPGEAAFAAYRADPDLRALTPARAITRRRLICGQRCSAWNRNIAWWWPCATTWAWMPARWGRRSVFPLPRCVPGCDGRCPCSASL